MLWAESSQTNVGSEKKDMPRPKLRTLDNMDAVLEAAEIDVDDVEFFRPNGNDPKQVVRLCEGDTAKGHALQGELCWKWTVSPASDGVQYKCSPLRRADAQQTYILVSGSVSLFTIDWNELDFIECVLRRGEVVVVPKGMSYCMMSSGQSSYIQIIFASESSEDWCPEWHKLVRNEHLNT
jgi:hypothetical protein